MLRRYAFRFGHLLLLLSIWSCLAPGMSAANRAAPAGLLLAGAARADITPPIGHPMGGYSARKGAVSGIHDALSARVLVLRSGGESVAFVSCDLRSFVADRVGETVRRKFGIEHVLVSSTHTHSGPVTWELRSAWYTETEEKIVRAVGEAASRLQPAVIGASHGKILLGHNRRRIGVDGRATMFWRNEDQIPTSPVDPTVTVIRVDTEPSGELRSQPIASIVHYACHPSILGPDNLLVSADYPGVTTREIEHQYGGVCLFWQGAPGDINPYRDKQPVDNGGFEAVEAAGKALAGEALRVLRGIRMESLPVRAAAELVPLRNRWDATKTISAGLTVVAVGERIGVIAVPGEPFVSLQLALRDKSLLPDTLLLGYTSSIGPEWVGYLPTIEAAASGGYGASYNTTVEVGAGERLVNRGLVLMYEMLGKLKAAPDGF